MRIYLMMGTVTVIVRVVASLVGRFVFDISISFALMSILTVVVVVAVVVVVVGPASMSFPSIRFFLFTFEVLIVLDQVAQIVNVSALICFDKLRLPLWHALLDRVEQGCLVQSDIERTWQQGKVSMKFHKPSLEVCDAHVDWFLSVLNE